MSPASRISAFVSYSHEDADDLRRLEVHLKASERTLPITFWRDHRQLRTGQSLDGEVKASIARSHIFVLAITPDFFASDYILDVELPAILARVDEVNGLILAIIVKRCRWQPFLRGDLVAAPLNDAGNLVPVRDWRREDGFDASAQQLHRAIKERYALGETSLLARRPQRRSGLVFEPVSPPSGTSAERLTSFSTVTDDDKLVAADPQTRQRHEEAKPKAATLAELSGRLGNNQTWAGLAKSAIRIVDLLSLDTSRLAEHSFVLWSLSQTLATYADQDDDLSSTPATDRTGDPLSPEQRRALDDLLTVVPILARRFPSVLRDDELLRHSPTPTVTSDAVEHIFKRARILDLLDKPTLESIDALYASPASNTQGVPTGSLGTIVADTARNLGIAAMSYAASWVALAHEKAIIGTDMPAETGLDIKAKRLVMEEQTALLSMYKEIPDMTRAIGILAGRLADRDYLPHVVPTLEAPNYSRREIEMMILEGKSPPSHLIPLIKELSFSSSKLASLSPLAELTSLMSLELDFTKVRDIAPLAKLTNLQRLCLDHTEVDYLAPLGQLTALKDLSLNVVGRLVEDTPASFRTDVLKPLIKLTQLETLQLKHTMASSLEPLSQLSELRSLDLTEARASDFIYLAKLMRLEILRLNHTQISDLKLLASLVQLRTLELNYTEVQDLAGLDSLTQLEVLALDGTKVDDLQPLARLPRLRYLTLNGTLVSDLAPLKKLANLETLRLDRTRIKELQPLAHLTQLKTLWLDSAQINDLKYLAALTQLATLNLDNAPVSDLGPLAGLAYLRALDLDNTLVSNVQPLVSLARLQNLRLNNTQVRDVTPLARLTQLQKLSIVGTPVSDLSSLGNLASLSLIEVRQPPEKLASNRIRALFKRREPGRNQAETLLKTLPLGWHITPAGDLERDA